MRPATACAQIIELHLAFDFFLDRQRFLPIDVGTPSKYDSPHKGRRKVDKRV
jgi:hypothetical protein